MIRDKKAKALLVDYSTLGQNGYPCSDIDAVHIENHYYEDEINGFVIFIEVKYEKGYFSGFQKDMYEHLCKNLMCGGATIFATHDKTWQNKDESIDLSTCQVREIFWDGKWHDRDNGETVLEVVRKMMTYERMRRYEESKVSKVQKPQN